MDTTGEEEAVNKVNPGAEGERVRDDPNTEAKPSKSDNETFLVEVSKTQALKKSNTLKTINRYLHCVNLNGKITKVPVSTQFTRVPKNVENTVLAHQIERLRNISSRAPNAPSTSRQAVNRKRNVICNNIEHNSAGFRNIVWDKYFFAQTIYDVQYNSQLLSDNCRCVIITIIEHYDRANLPQQIPLSKILSNAYTLKRFAYNSLQPLPPNDQIKSYSILKSNQAQDIFIFRVTSSECITRFVLFEIYVPKETSILFSSTLHICVKPPTSQLPKISIEGRYYWINLKEVAFTPTSGEILQMYPMAMDQSRQENVPTQHTLQVHMHHLCCPCSNIIYPYYPPGYRPPLAVQPPPILRPSYLHHYQYTQLHVNPAYNMQLPLPITQHLPQNISPSPPSTADLAFAPPPRDRRNLDGHEYDDPRQLLDKNKIENRNSLLQFLPNSENNYGCSTSSEQFQNLFKSLTATQVASLSTENFIKYLDNGCNLGEVIAKRNEHRPCFKNIQNLCNRTRTEVRKPNITVSNIHSQGVPWATKDLIFAFVRAINCWCILRGYLSSKDSNLGKIDREITQEFRDCYVKWEKDTKQLTHHLIQTFYKLDESNSFPNLSMSNNQNSNNPGPSSTVVNNSTGAKAKTTLDYQETPKKSQVFNEPTAQTNDKKFSNMDISNLKGVPGILHIPQAAAAELGEACNPNTKSTETSPPEDDSGGEIRVYMRRGSYNVRGKQQSSQSTTHSPRSIEFLDTAQNVGPHHRKISTTDKAEICNSDKVWQAAQSITPSFIKQNEEPTSNIVGNMERLYDLHIHQNKHIENWLNNERNIFDSVTPDTEEGPNDQPNDKFVLPVLRN